MEWHLWVDDLRDPPEDDNSWMIARNSNAAIYLLDNIEFVYVSLDHDLGGTDTTRPVVRHMCEHDIWPTTVVCHSQNPVGKGYIDGMIQRYKPRIVEFVPVDEEDDGW